MAKAYMCDSCKKLIKGDDIRITLNGYTVHHNEDNAEMPKGYGLGFPEEFCSFTCLADWATEQQWLLEDYLELVKNRRTDNG